MRYGPSGAVVELQEVPNVCAEGQTGLKPNQGDRRLQRIPPFKTLDVFRGFAALWVVMFHSCNRWLPDGNLAYAHVPFYALGINGRLGVTIFFVVSGYCIAAAAYSALVGGKTVWRYGYERIRRIYPPYLAAMFLAVFSGLAILYANAHHLIPAVHNLTTFPLEFKYWFANVLLLQLELNTAMPSTVFWSLCYEVVFYLLIGIFLQGAKWVAARHGLRAGTIFLVTCLGVSTIASLGELLLTGKPVFPFDLWHQFSLGGLLFFLLELKPETTRDFGPRFRLIVLANLVPVVALMLLFAALRQIGPVGLGFPSTRAYTLTCLVFAALLAGLRRFDDAVSSHLLLKPLMWVGAFTYSLYLVHSIVLPYVDILSRKAGLVGPWYAVAFWLQVIVATIFGRVFYLVVERRFISKRQVGRLKAEHVA